MNTHSLLARVAPLLGSALTVLSLHASAYGEPDSSFRSTSIEGFICRNSPTLLSDKSMLVHLWDQSALFSDPAFRHGVAKLNPDGMLDTSFGQQGLVTFEAPNNALNLLPLGDGRVLAVGNRATRLKANGSVDPTYGQAGTTEEFFPGRISGAALLPGDTLVVSSRPNGTVEFAWFTPDGQRAFAHGSAGRYSVPVEVGEVLYAWSQQSNGAVEMATFRVSADGRPEPRLRRLAPAAFGAASISAAFAGVMPAPGIATWTSSAVKVDALGGVVIATGTGNGSAFGPDVGSRISLTRFTADGALDASFGSAGTVSASTVGNEGQVTSAENPAAVWAAPGGGWTVLVDAVLGNGFGFGRLTHSTKRVLRFSKEGRLDASFSPGTPLFAEAVTQMDDGRLLQATSNFLAENNAVNASCTVKRLATDTIRVEGTLVEYYAPSLDHYFITLEGLEVGILDNHPEMGWKRTGARFGAWAATSLPGASRVCRFYGDLAAGPNSHFYIPEGAGCDGMKQMAADTPLGMQAWRLEGITFSTREAFGGQCPATLAPVYRFYNNGFAKGKDSNHRYSIDPSMSAAMMSQGWIAEGIAFCMPPASERAEIRAF